MKRVFRLLVACLLLALSGCGFHLRGAVTLPPVMEITYIEAQQPYAGMAAALREQLRSAGARLTDQRNEASAVLRILQHRSERRVLSVGSRGKASEYELFEEVVFDLLKPDGSTILERQSLRLTRDLVFDETQLLGKIEEASDIRRQMQRSLAGDIIARIGIATRAP